MTEQLLEQALIAALTAVLDGEDFVVDGVWQSVADGVQKGREDESVAVNVGCVVSGRSYETYSSCKVLFPAAIGIKVRAEMDPTGAAFLSACDKVTALLQTWQTSLADVKSVFTVSGFTPHGLKLDGGAPSYDRDAKAWKFNPSFTLRGVIS